MSVRVHSGLGIALLVAALLPVPSTAQVVIPSDRPGDERPELPPFEPPQVEEPPILPPYPVPKRPDTGGIAGGLKVFVREIRITGNTAISTEELKKIAAPYENRALVFADLQELRDKLTLAYVERGYVTSGAVLPEQTIRDGVVEIQIVEGKLEDVEIQTDGRFRTSYIRKRLERGPPGPVNVFKLEKRLQILQQDRRLRRVRAALVPADRRGLSVLRVSITEVPPMRMAGDFDNYHNPTIGSLGGGLVAIFDNALGIGDGIYARAAFTEGLTQVEGRFEAPLTAFDTLFTVRYQGSWADIIDDNFDFLDIESESESIGMELRQPLHRSLRTSIQGFVRGEWRRAESTLGLLDIGVPIPGAEDGESKVSVLRFGLDALHRTRSQALSARSQLSWGIDALDATVNSGGLPDGRFVSWLLQLQWAQRLPWLDAELVTRFDTQLADDPLLPLEQFAMGGRYTVRGYRENQLVRDNGLVGSAELRIPLFKRVEPRVQIELVPFFDAGYSWNTERPELAQQTLMSIGIGTRVFFTRWGRLEFFWGHRLKDIGRVGEYDVQDDGIHFRIGLNWP